MWDETDPRRNVRVVKGGLIMTLRNVSVMRLPALTPNSYLESKNNTAASPQRKMKSPR